ncbi:MAG TPA: SHOCT domain-containing protein [candidate division Zixibacteria bacterium]
MLNFIGMFYTCSRVWSLLLWILVILGAIVLVKWLLEKDKRTSESGENPLEILKRRYARGEIDREEFEQKKRDLLGS